MRLPEEVSASIIKVDRRIAGLGLPVFRSKELFAPAVHLLRNRGKLMRPSLVLLGAHVTGQDTQMFVDLAVSAELLHISSLIHDDIIDRDTVRRGVKAVHIRYGNEAAILAGDALISKSISNSAKYGKEVIESISEAAMDMCAGEALDYSFQKGKKVPKQSEYQRIAELKSASLIATCCNIAAVYKKDKLAGRLHAFGRNVGIAFQMRDDILDSIEGTEKKSGFRPNIITTLMEHLSLSGKEAVDQAIELHNRHIDTAIKELGSSESTDLLAVYADTIRVK
jgi:geranylgeranyl pyrophosphate synthase